MNSATNTVHAVITPLQARSDPAFQYGRFFDGIIHEVMIFDRDLSYAERLAVEQGMGQRWSVPVKSKCPALKMTCTVLALHHGF
jgi:hypothetical protein